MKERERGAASDAAASYHARAGGQGRLPVRGGFTVPPDLPAAPSRLVPPALWPRGRGSRVGAGLGRRSAVLLVLLRLQQPDLRLDAVELGGARLVHRDPPRPLEVGDEPLQVAHPLPVALAGG